jgi:hypothetical protein
MTDLTEQWKKGELPIGWYYIKLWKGCNVIDYFIGNQFLRYDDSDIVEVIAPVPTFDEWQEKLRALDAAYETIKMEDETINRLVRSGKQCNYENAQLKELLKDCQEKILLMDYDSIKIEILQKINEVLK